ncbi:hypothetical protein SDJN02_14729, partial [Cucurbita argyrosperma subsp. argyrosperma]
MVGGGVGVEKGIGGSRGGQRLEMGRVPVMVGEIIRWQSMMFHANNVGSLGIDKDTRKKKKKKKKGSNELCSENTLKGCVHMEVGEAEIADYENC